MAFKRLVRFVEGGQPVYGDLIKSDGDNHTVKKLTGSPFGILQETDVIIQTNKVSQCVPDMHKIEQKTNRTNLSCYARLSKPRWLFASA